VVKDSKNSPLANRFVDYLVSPEGQNILAEFGFSKP
jgi:ABC-type molybdate transport system substrate-binding protein